MKLSGEINEESSDTKKMNENNTADMADSFSDEELENVVGGIGTKNGAENSSPFICPICQSRIYLDISMYLYNNYITCPTCRTTFPIERVSMVDKVSEILERIKG